MKSDSDIPQYAFSGHLDQRRIGFRQNVNSDHKLVASRTRFGINAMAMCWLLNDGIGKLGLSSLKDYYAQLHARNPEAMLINEEFAWRNDFRPLSEVE